MVQLNLTPEIVFFMLFAKQKYLHVERGDSESRSKDERTNDLDLSLLNAHFPFLPSSFLPSFSPFWCHTKPKSLLNKQEEVLDLRESQESGVLLWRKFSKESFDFMHVT